MTVYTLDDTEARALSEAGVHPVPKTFRNRAAIVVLLLLTIGTSVWQYVITDDTSHSLVPLRLAVADIGQNVAEFHIWLEEKLQGDEYLTREEVMGLIDAVSDRIQTIRTGGVFDGATLPNIDDPALLAVLTELDGQIMELRDLAEQRFAMGDQGVSGTEIDQMFDRHYTAVVSTYGRAVSNLDIHIADNLSRVTNVSLLLVGLSIAVKVLIVGLMLSSHRSLHRLIARLSGEIEKTERALREADRSQRAKSAFLAMMSHELRTPLNAIMGFSEIMKLEMFGNLHSKYKEYSRAIYSSAERFLSVINTLIDISRIESQEKLNGLEPVNVADLVREIHEILSQRAEDGGVSIHIDIHDDVNTIMANKKVFGDIVINVFHNAVKFTPAGGEVRVRCRGDGDSVALSIEDTGIGMTEEEIDMAMRAFSQVNPHLARTGEGSGLGLPLAKMATESLGGTFSITSQKGVGTRVQVSLPRGT